MPKWFFGVAYQLWLWGIPPHRLEVIEMMGATAWAFWGNLAPLMYVLSLLGVEVD